jgi:hypothetical protein
MTGPVKAPVETANGDLHAGLVRVTSTTDRSAAVTAHHFEVSMRHMLIVAAVGIMLIGVGCENGKMKNPFKKKATTQESELKMSTAKDDCPMCPGVQHADANGKCPACGMKVKS